MSYKVGSHVKIGAKRGVVHFVGETSFATGVWYGVVLEQPKGKNDGTVNGEKYFTCPPNYGLFCKKSQVRIDRAYKPPATPAPEPNAPPAPTKPSPTPSSTPTSTTSTLPPNGATPVSATPTIHVPQVNDLASFKGETGTVVFVGNTEFSTGIWCGLVLTTPTGKNNGSVKGKSYFTCKDKHGLFVQPENLTFVGKQPVSKATDRADRAAPAETKTSSTAAARRAARAARATRSTRSSMDGTEDTTKDTKDTTKDTTAPIATKSSITATAATTAITATTTPLSSPSRSSPNRTTTRLLREQRLALEANTKTIKELRGALDLKDSDIQRLELEKQKIHASLSSSSASEEETKQLYDKIARLETTHKNNLHLLTTCQSDHDATKLTLSTLESSHHVLTTKLTQLQDSRSSTVASQVENVAAVSKAERRNLELEEEMSELNDMIETLALEKEEIQLEKEIVDATLVDVQLELEQKTIEVDHLKLEQAQTGGTRSGGGSDGGEGGGGGGEDDVSVLREQNSKLRQALLRLRDSGALERAEMEKKMLLLEKNQNTAEQTSGRMDSLIADNANMKDTIKHLKDQVDDAQAFEHLVEDMTDKNLELSDEVVELKGTVSELEELRELSEEVEAQHVEIQQQLQQEMLDKDRDMSRHVQKHKAMSERTQSLGRDLERYREIVQERDATIEDLETRMVTLETSHSSMVGEAAVANDVKLSAREMTESVRVNGLTSKTARSVVRCLWWLLFVVSLVVKVVVVLF